MTALEGLVIHDQVAESKVSLDGLVGNDGIGTIDGEDGTGLGDETIESVALGDGKAFSVKLFSEVTKAATEEGTKSKEADFFGK